MSTTVEGRTLVKTATRGWYKDLADPDGPNVRKQATDTILDESPAGTETEADERSERLKNIGDSARNGSPAAEKPEPVKTTLSTDKVVVGKTTVIQCAWVDPDKRTKAQQKLFAGPTKDITFEKVTKAAGDDTAALPCGIERTIKVQDAFQVRFCPEHTALRRNELRRIQNQARAKAAKAAGTK